MGGGHDAAGTCQIANESAEEVLKETVELLRSQKAELVPV